MVIIEEALCSGGKTKEEGRREGGEGGRKQGGVQMLYSGLMLTTSAMASCRFSSSRLSYSTALPSILRGRPAADLLRADSVPSGGEAVSSEAVGKGSGLLAS